MIITYPGSEEDGFYPRYVADTISNLSPNQLNLLRAKEKLEIIFCHFTEGYDIENMIEFVKFQYPTLDPYDIISNPSEEKYNDRGVGTITIHRSNFSRGTQYPVQDPLLTRREPHLQESLNMIFSIDPFTNVQLLLIDEIINVGNKASLTTPSEKYEFIFNKIYELQKKYPNSVYISNVSIATPYLPSQDFYYYYCKGEEPKVQIPNIKKPQKVTIPMFIASGNQEWIYKSSLKHVGGISTPFGIFGATYYYNPTFFSKDTICHIGGCDNQQTSYFANTSGFCFPEICSSKQSLLRYSKVYPEKNCTEILPPYQDPFNENLPEPQCNIFNICENKKKSFRIPDYSEFSGPYILFNYNDISFKTIGTSFSVILAGMQYARLAYLGLYPSILSSFIENLYNNQYQKKNWFQYINMGKILANPPDEPFTNCDYENYKIEDDEGGAIIGLNPCGLGKPLYENWT